MNLATATKLTMFAGRKDVNTVEPVATKNFAGLTICIEHKKGTTRVIKNDAGVVVFKTKMHADYGYFKDSVGRDGDETDVFIGPDKEADQVFTVHMLDKGHDIAQREDEDKCFIGYASHEAALQSFLQHYPEHFYGGMTSLPVETFVQKLKEASLPHREKKIHAGGPGSGRHPAGLSENERSAVQTQLRDPSFVNTSLRGSGVLSKEQQSHVDALDSAIKQSPVLDAGTVLYRAISRNFATESYKSSLASNGLNPGSTFTDKGFVSTTTDRNVANDPGYVHQNDRLVLHITVPDGIHALAPKDAVSGEKAVELASWEHELLLPRNQTFRIDKTKGSNLYVTLLKHGMQAGGPGSGRKPTVQPGLNTRQTHRMLWAIKPSGGVILHKADLKHTHADWFKKIGLSYAGPSYDKIQRGSTMIFPTEKKAVLHSYTNDGVTPNEVYQHVQSVLPPTYQLQCSTASASAIQGGGKGSGCHGDRCGRPGEGKKTGSTNGLTKAEIAKINYKPANKEHQRIADKMEIAMSSAIGLSRTPNNSAFDLQSSKIGVEVKTLIDQKNGKISMNHAAVQRKLKVARQNDLRIYTLVVDARDKKDVKYLMKPGVGSFRINGMTEVDNLATLKRKL
jgi:hypothetical protein